MMTNGLYALASLDGRPLAPTDLAVLGLGDRGDAARHMAFGCVLAARDVRAAAVHTREHADGIDILLGDLDEPEDVASALGLSTSSDPLTLACAAFERFGERTPAQLLGTWLFARWHASSAKLTLLMAERVRDTCYVAIADGRVAVAPQLVRLARLDWVDSTPDPRGLLLLMGRAALRRGIGRGTMLREVERVMPGTCLTVGMSGVRRSVAEPPPIYEVATSLSFDETMEQIDAVLRRIMRQHFDRHGDSAFMLSGGLDSSLLALIGSLERGNRKMTFLTSASPPGSDIPDETAFAAIVANHLGLPMEKIAPAPDADIFRPSSRAFGAIEMPAMSSRHYIDDALQGAAYALGVGAVVDGTGGEMTLTSYTEFFEPSPRPTPIRDMARDLRNRWWGRGGAERWPRMAFHVRLSQAALNQIPCDFADLWAKGQPRSRALRHDQPLGIEYGVLKTAVAPSSTSDPRLRLLSPFFDHRLIRIAATMPASFIGQNGWQRAPARALMQGRLPDSIAFRQSRMPFSPTYKTMLQDQAQRASNRVALHREAGIGEYIDLDWLAAALARTKSAPIDNQGAMSELQSTAIAAEFLLWWQSLGFRLA